MKKYLIVIFVILVLVYLGSKLSPGNYVNAEKFELPIDQGRLVSIIADFKEENPQYKVPISVGLSDGKNDSQDHWYHIYFYYPEENQIIYTWLREEGKGKTIFAFVSVSNGLQLGKWSDINKDLSVAESKDQKEKFENRILRIVKGKI